jgi:proteasome lid subunit RPN8/RPN11
MPFTPTEEQVAAALAHAAESQPMESCGVIAGGEYVRLRNAADGERDTFAIDMREYHEVEKAQVEVEAIVHSHVYLPPIASEGDRASCERTGKPWLILTWPTADWAVLEPTGWKAPLVGRQWAWGTQDCWSLVRDGFEQYTGILLPDFDSGDWDWWKKGGDLIAEHFKAGGFRQLPSDTAPQHCDVFGMRVHSPVVNHLGLFLAPDVLLHQVAGQMSQRVVYGGTYLKMTELHLRHERFMEAPPA